MQKIVDRIYVGSGQDFVRPKILDDYGITAILNVAVDLIIPVKLQHMVQAWVPLTESEWNEPELYLAAIALLQGLVEDHQVLVCCQNGKSRSAAVVMMYLEMNDPKGWEHWYAHLNKLYGAQPAACHRKGFNFAFLMD